MTVVLFGLLFLLVAVQAEVEREGGEAEGESGLMAILGALERERETELGSGLAHVLPLPLPGETDAVREKRNLAEGEADGGGERERLCSLAAAGPLFIVAGAPTDGQSLLAGGEKEHEQDGLCGLGGKWVLVSSGIPAGRQESDGEGGESAPSTIVGTALPHVATLRYLATAATAGALSASAFAPQSDHTASASASSAPSLAPSSSLRPSPADSLTEPDPHGSFGLPFVRAINDLAWTMRERGRGPGEGRQTAGVDESVDPSPHLAALATSCSASSTDPLPCPLVSKDEVCADVAALYGWLEREADGGDDAARADDGLTVRHASSLLHCLALTSLSSLARSSSLASHHEAQATLNAIATALSRSVAAPPEPPLPPTLPHLTAFLALRPLFRSLSSLLLLSTLIELGVMDDVVVENGNVASEHERMRQEGDAAAAGPAWTNVVVVVDRAETGTMLNLALSHLDPLTLSLSLSQECLYCELVGACERCGGGRGEQEQARARARDEL
jgi:hypothetical protein